MKFGKQMTAAVAGGLFCVMALGLVASACGDDGLSRGTRSRLEISETRLEFTEPPKAGFQSESTKITISNGGDAPFKFKSFDVVLDDTQYIRLKGSLPDLALESEAEFGVDEAISLQLVIEVPDPNVDDTPLTCPTPPADLPTAIDPGSYCGQITINTNADDEPTATAYVLVNVQSGKLSVTPDVLVFDNPQPGQLVTKKFTVMNQSTSGNLEIRNTVKTGFTEGTADLFSVVGFDGVTLPPGDSVEYDVEYRPETMDSVSGVIEVNSNGGTARITVRATAGGNSPIIEVTPDSLIFPNASPGNPETKTISVANSGVATLVVSQMRVVPNEASAVYTVDFDGQTSIARNQAMDFEVTYAPVEAASVGGTLRIFSNAGNVPTGEVPVTLSGNSAAPSGSVAPGEVLFHAAPGETHRRSIVFSNDGVADLLINSYEFSSNSAGEFSLDPDPSGTTVAPGAIYSTEVVYARLADDVGMDVSNLTINTNNPFNNGDLVLIARNDSDENATAPVADIAASPDGAVTVGTLVNLSGAGSAATAPQTIASHSWLMIERPAGSTADLSPTENETTAFTPDVAGTYRVQLIVRNSLGIDGSAIREITVTQ